MGALEKKMGNVLKHRGVLTFPFKGKDEMGMGATYVRAMLDDIG